MPTAVLRRGHRTPTAPRRGGADVGGGALGGDHPGVKGSVVPMMRTTVRIPAVGRWERTGPASGRTGRRQGHRRGIEPSGNGGGRNSEYGGGRSAMAADRRPASNSWLSVGAQESLPARTRSRRCRYASANSGDLGDQPHPQRPGRVPGRGFSHSGGRNALPRAARCGSSVRGRCRIFLRR